MGDRLGKSFLNLPLFIFILHSDSFLIYPLPVHCQGEAAVTCGPGWDGEPAITTGLRVSSSALCIPVCTKEVKWSNGDADKTVSGANEAGGRGIRDKYRF